MIHDFSLVFDTENSLWQRVLNANDDWSKRLDKLRNLCERMDDINGEHK